MVWISPKLKSLHTIGRPLKSSLARLNSGVKQQRDFCYSTSMLLMFYWLAGVSLVELSLWLPGLWKFKRVLACTLIPALALLSGLLAGTYTSVWTGVIFLFSIYRIINLLRVLEGRMQPDHLFRSTRQTSLWLIGLQLAAAATGSLDERYSWLGATWPFLLTGFQLAVATLLWMSTIRSLRTTKPPASRKTIADHELPTLSVAIPARNETDDLDACLQSLVMSDYPKLEILVLDDCSQNKSTPGIIRDFAHAGVRFVAGKTPPTHWLAKNYAYDQLAKEANGDQLLFCGVDTRFQPETLRTMVETLLQKRKSMISFLPHNQVPTRFSVESLLVQPARYAWELSLPRRQLRRPPVLSTCWLISTKELKAAGGFEAVSRSIAPESYFAKSSTRHKDGYSFMQSDQTMDLGSTKSLAEQRGTAIRTRYPQLHRRPELVSLFGLGEVVAFVLPIVMLVLNLSHHNWLLATGSLATLALLVDFYSRIVSLAYRQFLWRGLWALPLVALYDLGLLNYSMWQYEFREVIWKGRNVCIPVMRTITAGSGRRP